MMANHQSGKKRSSHAPQKNEIDILLSTQPNLAALPFPDIDPVIFSIGIFSIRWYALAYIFSILIGWWVLRRITSAPDDPVGKAPLDDLLNYGIVGIILGGRIGYALGYNTFYFIQNPIEIFYIWQGGMSFHGGFLGMALSIYLVARKHKISVIALGDLIALVAPIGLFFGRISNFINGELFGRTTDLPWGFVFPNGGPFPRHPSQLYEAGLEGLVLFLLLAVAYKNGARQKKGLMIGIFLAGYGISRTLVETLREPDAHLGFIFGQVTMGQILSAPMIALGIFIISRSVRNTPK